MTDTPDVEEGMSEMPPLTPLVEDEPEDVVPPDEPDPDPDDDADPEEPDPEEEG